VPLTVEAFGHKFLKPLVGYSYAAGEGLAPIAGAEFPVVSRSLPIAFVQQGGEVGAVTLMSVVPRRNLLVGPDGRWLGPYVPAAIRAYPFRLVRREERPEEWVLCIDGDCPSIVDAENGAEALFGPDGSLAARVKAVVGELEQFEQSRLMTGNAVAALARVGVLRPWELKLASGAILNGLLRVDEVALNQLNDDRFLELRRVSGLALAYTQLLSMAHIATLQRMLDVHSELARRQGGEPPALGGTFGMLSGESLYFG